MLLSCALPVLLASVASATNLFVSSYAGPVTTLELTRNASAKGYNLQTTSSTNECAYNASWLLFEPYHRVLYCIGEGLDSQTRGGLTVFSASDDGILKKTDQHDTPWGGVNAAIYHGKAGNHSLAIAHYGGSAISTWTLDNCGEKTSATPFQTINFNMSAPGPHPQQNKPHPHQVIVDPTHKFLASPDLGADLVRMFAIDPNSGTLSECPALSVDPGSGPRHAHFVTSPGKHEGKEKRSPSNETVVLYVVAEIANTITAYKVSYPAQGGCPTFTQIEQASTFGSHALPNNMTAAAEIAVSSDIMIVSNRNDNSTYSANGIFSRDTSNSTIISDTLSTFSLNSTGSFDFVSLFPAGGRYPRQFSLNRRGNLVAVALQLSSKVAVISRNVTTGNFLQQVAEIELEGQITSVVWDDGDEEC
ncbi:hypothetical protein MMC30_005885 [Trapelia coarctata]|nr:hypothetical protein [Trapelia coarctata]